MFSFGAKKSNPPKARAKPQHSDFLNALNVGDFDDLGGGNPDNDSDDSVDLEAELAALTGGNTRAIPKKKKPVPTKRPAVAASYDFSAEVNSDSECSSIDDAEVEGELQELCQDDEETSEKNPSSCEAIAVPSSGVLDERLKMYNDAKAIAAQKGDTAKARRFERGIKTIKDLMKQAASGKPISADDIPPILPGSCLSSDQKAVGNASTISTMPPSEDRLGNTIEELSAKIEGTAISSRQSVGLPPPIPNRPSPGIPPPIPSRTSSGLISQAEINDNADTQKLLQLRQEYKTKALAFKQEGNRSSALETVRLVKVCDQLINAAQEGKPIDWSQLSLESNKQPSVTTENQPATSARPVPEEPSNKEHNINMPAPSDVSNEAVQSSAPPVERKPEAEIPMPRTTLEALEQRLAKYQSIVQESADNASKARRVGRIVKQYQDAIRLCKAGKTVPFDELPDPPGYPPIPGASRKVDNDEQDQPVAAQPTPIESKQAPAANVSSPTQIVKPPPAPPVGAKPKIASQTKQEKQLAILIERQVLLKQAAVESKKAGDMIQAKEYLKSAKGFDPLIEASRGGVRIDMSTIPIPPQLKRDVQLAFGDKVTEDGFVDLSLEPSVMPISDTGHAAVTQLDLLLEEQRKKCIHFRNYHKEIGDVANANRFDQMLLATLNDIQKVRKLVLGGAVPTWMYEMKVFTIPKCCTDLKDDELEVKVIRGIAFNVPNPKTVDTYVKFEVPLPNTENVTKHRTNLVKDTNNPEFDEKFVVNFSRQSRTCQRIFKSKAIKFEVYSKGGFLRSDVLLGTATLKLNDLTNHCKVHTTIDLLEGRKVVGGKLEVMARVREPLVEKETEKFHEKWVVLN